MNVEVTNAIQELKTQFSKSTFIVKDDDQGGAYVIIENMLIGERFSPQLTWFGFQLPAQYPYADIYPVFMDGNVVLANGAEFVAPVTKGHIFEGRPAIQISRRNGAAQSGSQKATMKLLKIIDFLEKMP